MYSRYGRGYFNHNYNNQAIETVCDDVGVTAEYSNMPSNCCNCGCNNCCCDYDDSKGCGCGFDEEINLFPSNPMLAQSYVPIQYMDKTFTPCCGLKMGTIFPELVSPYRPGQSMQEIDYIRSRNEIGEGCNG